MAQPPIYGIDADGTIRTDALHWEGFPRILWETLSEVGYVTPPLYEVVSFWDQGVPYARTTATVLPHPEHPEWEDLSMVFFAHAVWSRLSPRPCGFFTLFVSSTRTR
jgi:hypothetical protein